MDQDTIVNIVVCVVCVVVLIAYHVWLVSVVKRNPQKTVYGVTSHGRKAWVAAMIRGKKDILAIQSLRNLIMVSSILGSTSIVLIFGFLNFLASRVSGSSTSATKDPTFGFVLDDLFSGKSMVLCLILCVSFFCFAQAMRFYNHTGMVINIALPELEHAAAFKVDTNNHTAGGSATQNLEQPENRSSREKERLLLQQATNIDFVGDMLNRGSLYHTAGLRGYYLTFPVLGYLWGPWALLGSTVVLVGILRIVDFNLDSLSPRGGVPGGFFSRSASPVRLSARGGGGGEVASGTDFIAADAIVINGGQKEEYEYAD